MLTERVQKRRESLDSTKCSIDNSNYKILLKEALALSNKTQDKNTWNTKEAKFTKNNYYR